MDGGGGNRAEAERWLYTANKLLSARDLHGAQSFAIRARESDPTFDASELLLTVIDTLLAGETRINDQHRDWYGILQILRYSTNIDHIAAQYHRLALLLDPHRNPFAFAAHAFSLIHDAWSVLSNPAKKAMYDADLRLLTSTPPPAPAATQHHHHQHHQHNPLTQAQPQSTPRRNLDLRTLRAGRAIRMCRIGQRPSQLGRLGRPSLRPRTTRRQRSRVSGPRVLIVTFCMSTLGFTRSAPCGARAAAGGSRRW
ncbi:hypothetical protein HN873_044874 [Arachis hypogaea]